MWVFEGLSVEQMKKVRYVRSDPQKKEGDEIGGLVEVEICGWELNGDWML